MKVQTRRLHKLRDKVIGSGVNDEGPSTAASHKTKVVRTGRAIQRLTKGIKGSRPNGTGVSQNESRPNWSSHSVSQKESSELASHKTKVVRTGRATASHKRMPSELASHKRKPSELTSHNRI